jgi:hypothetical protein
VNTSTTFTDFHRLIALMLRYRSREDHGRAVGPVTETGCRVATLLHTEQREVARSYTETGFQTSHRSRTVMRVVDLGKSIFHYPATLHEILLRPEERCASAILTGKNRPTILGTTILSAGV